MAQKVQVACVFEIVGAALHLDYRTLDLRRQRGVGKFLHILNGLRLLLGFLSLVGNLAR